MGTTVATVFFGTLLLGYMFKMWHAFTQCPSISRCVAFLAQFRGCQRFMGAHRVLVLAPLLSLCSTSQVRSLRIAFCSDARYGELLLLDFFGRCCNTETPVMAAAAAAAPAADCGLRYHRTRRFGNAWLPLQLMLRCMPRLCCVPPLH
jgi:hypothetical protein